jgi:hypothetical protein
MTEELRDFEEDVTHGRMNYKIKTPNPKCRLFFQVGLLTDFAALCSTDFIDWRYIHSWLVFSTQLVNSWPHGRSNYTCVLCCHSTSSLTSPPPLPKVNVQYRIHRQCVAVGGWGWGGVELGCRTYSAGV